MYRTGGRVVRSAADFVSTTQEYNASAPFRPPIVGKTMLLSERRYDAACIENRGVQKSGSTILATSYLSKKLATPTQINARTIFQKRINVSAARCPGVWDRS
jgi:hypothetical protein